MVAPSERGRRWQANTYGQESRYVIVIPAYNHKNQIRQVAEKALRLGFPVIIVDDGSSDSTPELLNSIPGVTVLRHDRNLGKGAALTNGFTAGCSKADFAVTVDADGQHNPEEIPALIQAIPDGKKPLVIGNRERMDKNDVPWTSRWGREFSNFWVWAACGRWFSDSQSGFRIYPLPETIRLGTRTKRYQFEIEVLIRAVWQEIPVIEVPVHVFYGRKHERVSHFRPWLDFWRNTRTFARLLAMRFLVPRKLRK
jgi:glycosyltransferase involved in cell wall biosynthesis